MDGTFDEQGGLVIKRGAREVSQKCLHNPDMPCGDWCPQVSEPIRQENKKLDRKETIIHICQGRHWKFTGFEDRRRI